MGAFVIFTDLDGTLWGHQTYAFEAVRPALKLLKDREIPLIFCSSKTRAEVERYRRLLHDGDPFIIQLSMLIYAPGVGSEGWNAALVGLFAREGGNGR